MKICLSFVRIARVVVLIPIVAGCRSTNDRLRSQIAQNAQERLGREAAMGEPDPNTCTDAELAADPACISPNAQLKEAIANNNAEGVLKAAARGAALDECTTNGSSAARKCTSPMAAALAAGRTNAALALIEGGVNVNAQNFRGETLLGFAVHYNNPPVIKALLEKGADPNYYHGITYAAPAVSKLLSRAVVAKQAKAVEYLLKYGAEADWKDRFGRTAYWYAGGKLTAQEEARLTPDMRRIRQLLRQAKVNPDPRDYRGRSYAQVLKLKINHEVEADVADYRAFTDQSGVRENVAGRLYRVEPVDKLKKAPRAHNAKQQVRLYKAIKNNDVAALKTILKEDKPELNALLGEAAGGNFDGNSTPLTMAIDGQKNEIVILLLKAGADPMTVDQGIWSPLHSASHKGNAVIVRALLQHGADPNYGTLGEGTTPLMFAAMSGSAECVKLLLDKGANPDARERNERNDSDPRGSVEYYIPSEQPEIRKLIEQAHRKRKAKKS